MMASHHPPPPLTVSVNFTGWWVYCRYRTKKKEGGIYSLHNIKAILM